MANYEALKASVAKNGEVMIRLDTGEKIELHIHNVQFDDATNEVVVDAASQTCLLVLTECHIIGFTKRV